MTNHISEIRSITDLKEAYRVIIADYLSNCKSDERFRAQLLLADKLDSNPRFWNCVGVDETLRRKGDVLWASINPSDGGTLYPEKNAPFNIPWTEIDRGASYWRDYTKKTSLISTECCHMDLLPIHLSKEPRLLNILFHETETSEFRLACDLLRCTQRVIELLEPRLIIYSNASTRWLWGADDAGWLGYDLATDTPLTRAVSEAATEGYVNHGKRQPSVFEVKGIKNNNVSGLSDTKLKGTCLVIDYQVGGRNSHLGLTKDDVKAVWDVIKGREFQEA